MCCLQTSAVQTQTTRVQKLQMQAATGKVSVARLEQEQGVLTKMTVRPACSVPAAPTLCVTQQHSVTQQHCVTD